MFKSYLKYKMIYVACLSVIALLSKLNFFSQEIQRDDAEGCGLSGIIRKNI
jgi:hypothetical protein